LKAAFAFYLAQMSGVAGLSTYGKLHAWMQVQKPKIAGFGLVVSKLMLLGLFAARLILGIQRLYAGEVVQKIFWGPNHIFACCAELAGFIAVMTAGPSDATMAVAAMQKQVTQLRLVANKLQILPAQVTKVLSEVKSLKKRIPRREAAPLASGAVGPMQTPMRITRSMTHSFSPVPATLPRSIPMQSYAPHTPLPPHALIADERIDVAPSQPSTPRRQLLATPRSSARLRL